jgi:serine/threonine protein kinase
LQLCRDTGYDVCGIPVIDESRGVATAWVKYGLSVTMGEALTQDWVGQVLNANPDAVVQIPKVYRAFEHGSFGYIVMEYIDGLACDDSDTLQVASTVEYLIRVTGPTIAPGPVPTGRLQ